MPTHLPQKKQIANAKLIGIPTAWLLFLFFFCIALTLVEILIVNRKYGILEGGFLATPLSGLSEISLLVLAVLSSNMLVALICFFPTAMLCLRTGAAAHIALAFSTFIAIFPIILMDLIAYQLIKYLGDQISFYFIAQIAGRSIGTMLSFISDRHWLLLTFTFIACFVAIFMAAKIWMKYGNIAKGHLRRQTFIIYSSVLLACTLLIVGSASLSSEKVIKGIRRFPASRGLQLSLHALTDVDRDGYSTFSHPPDRNWADPNRHPFALDIPANGIDENGLMGDLPRLSEIQTTNSASMPTFRRHPLFVLLVLESFRHDVLFQKVNGKEITPNLNQLALQGVYTRFGFSHNGYTVGSLNAIFRGTMLSKATTSLIDDFKANGYFTACFSAADESFGDVAASTGLNRVDFFYDARQDIDRRSFPFTASGSLTVPAEVVLNRLEQFLGSHLTGNQPLFLYINLQDLHFPYHHYAVRSTIIDQPLARSQINHQNQTELMHTYLNTAVYLDENIGKIVALLKSYYQGELAVVIASDHGESLFDDQFLGHGYHLSDSQTRIPFIAYGFPAVLEEPMGQDELRTMIRAGLSVSSHLNRPPVKISNPPKQIFQYLGSLKRPKHIGWTHMQGRLVLDLRNYRWQSNHSTSWQPIINESIPEDLASLVHYWETIQLKEVSP